MTATEQQQIFNQWLGQYKALIFKVVRAYTIEQADRDDLFQEICLQLWRSVPSFRSEAAVSTWIYRIAIRAAMTWKGQEKRERERTKHYAESQPLLQLPDTMPDERIVWLYEEIQKMDAVDRSLALLLLDGYSYKDMAQLLGISESNVGVKIFRIKKRLTQRAAQFASDGI